MIKKGMRLGQESLSQSSLGKRTRDGFEIEPDGNSLPKRTKYETDQLPPQSVPRRRPPMESKEKDPGSSQINFLGILNETNKRREEERRRKEEEERYDFDSSPNRSIPEQTATGSVSNTSIGSRGFSSETEENENGPKIGFSWAMKCFGSKMPARSPNGPSRAPGRLIVPEHVKDDEDMKKCEEAPVDKNVHKPSKLRITIPAKPAADWAAGPAQLSSPLKPGEPPASQPPGATAAAEGDPPIFVRTNADIQVQWVHHLPKSGSTSARSSPPPSASVSPSNSSGRPMSTTVTATSSSASCSPARTLPPVPSELPPVPTMPPRPSTAPARTPLASASLNSGEPAKKFPRRKGRSKRDRKDRKPRGEKRKNRPAFNPKVSRVKPKEAIKLTKTQIMKRQAQINLGKSTQGYQKYLIVVPKKHRKSKHPKTPDVHDRISKRRFDGKIRAWRRALHEFDSFQLDQPLPVELEARAGGGRMDCEGGDARGAKPVIKLEGQENLPGLLISSFKIPEKEDGSKLVAVDVGASPKV